LSSELSQSCSRNCPPFMKAVGHLLSSHELVLPALIQSTASTLSHPFFLTPVLLMYPMRYKTNCYNVTRFVSVLFQY
jgi:hypothetical protein